MGWRFWKKKAGAGERTAVDRASAPPAPEPPAGADLDAPRVGDFMFEPMPEPLAEIEATPSGTEAAGAVGRPAIRGLGSGLGRRLGGTPPLAQPVLVPSLREQALVYRLAAEARGGSDPAEALALWRTWLELCPGDGAAWFSYGQLLLGEGRITDAEQAFLSAQHLVPEHAHAAGALGYLSGLAGRWPEAVAHYQRAVELIGEISASRDLLEALAEAQAAAGDSRGAAATRDRLAALDRDTVERPAVP